MYIQQQFYSGKSDQISHNDLELSPRCGSPRIAPGVTDKNQVGDVVAEYCCFFCVSYRVLVGLRVEATA